MEEYIFIVIVYTHRGKCERGFTLDMTMMFLTLQSPIPSNPKKMCSPLSRSPLSRSTVSRSGWPASAPRSQNPHHK